MSGRACNRYGQGERGSASAELVVATPLLLLLILAVIQFALWQHAMHVADAAAQQGLAAARVETGTEATGQTEADAVLRQLGVLSDPHVAANRTVDTTTVAITGEAPSVLPLFRLPVRAVASGPSERFRPPGSSQ
jgi:Flp pilus assembly protein TadG